MRPARGRSVPDAEAAAAPTTPDRRWTTSRRWSRPAAAEKAEQKGGARVVPAGAATPAPSPPALGPRWATRRPRAGRRHVDGTVVGYALARGERLADGGLLGMVDDLYVDPGARERGHRRGADGPRCSPGAGTQGCFGVDSLALPGDRATKNFFESFGLVARAIVVHKPFT